jgi:choline dehydrogenase-like flavoprotein
MTDALDAAGATRIWAQHDDTCHLNGTARMGDDPATSVVNADCRSWDIPNLWICDGSVFPTVGGVNPSLTIQAIACRTADRIAVLASFAASCRRESIKDSRRNSSWAESANRKRS